MKVAAGLNLALELIIAAQKLQVLVARAQLAGRDSFSEEEQAQIASNRSEAMSRLDEAIEKAESEGR